MQRTILISLIVLGSVSLAMAQDIYTKPGIPDVDKPDRNKDGVWPDANDNSCWIATASNLLAAAGYGQGATAQQRGDYVYSKIVGDLGFLNAGRAEWAINYYMYKYAKNPNAGIDFQNNIKYTDVTYKRLNSGNLLKSDYDFLIDELKRCQYVGISFGGTDWGHAVTLIGGGPSTPNGNPTVIHDSDRDQGGVDDNTYNSWYDAANNWHLSDYSAGGMVDVYAYQTLCPGLNKPIDSVMNYDVAWYRNVWDAASSILMPTFQETGRMASIYADPYWDTSNTMVTLGNQRSDTLTKSVYLLVDLADRSGDQYDYITLLDDQGKYWDPTSIISDADKGQLLYTWQLNFQPGWEQIVFPNTEYYNLNGRIKDWNVTSQCVPGPAAAISFAVAFATMLRSRKRR